MQPASTPDLADPNWCLDSGATHHMTSSPNNLSNVQPYLVTDSIVVGNGSQLSISHIGQTTVSTPAKALSLNGVLCVPTIKKNLISIRRFACDNDCYFEMDYDGFCVKDKKTVTSLLIGSKFSEIISHPSHFSAPWSLSSLWCKNKS
jgi:hypothetical protein